MSKTKFLAFFKWIGFALVLFYCIVQGIGGGDFQIYLGASELLKNNQSCYNSWITLGESNFGSYSYSPFFALILIPLTYLPSGVAEILWLFLNLFLLYRILIITMSFLDISIHDKRSIKIWFGLSLILSIRFILHNFEMVQVNIFLLYTCLESLFQIYKKNPIRAGLILSLGAIIKILPIVMIPYFLYQRRFSLVFYTGLFLLSFLLLPSVFFGWGFNISMLSEWWGIVNPKNQEFLHYQNALGEGIHSLSGLVSAYFTEISGNPKISYNRMIFELSKEQIFNLVNLLRIILIVFTLYFLLPIKKKLNGSKFKAFYQVSYILLITPLIFPHQQKYAFVFIVPAIAYCSHGLILGTLELWKKKIGYIILIVFSILAVLSTDGIVGSYINDLSEYYKTITFGTLLLIPLLALLKQKHFLVN